jgi:RNA-splicing ligase RtcB
MQPELLESLPDTVTEDWISSVLKRIGMDEKTFWHSLATVGGGNHFLELDSDGETDVITLHFGSRNFGKKVCEYWTAIANGVMKLDKATIGKVSTEARKEYIKEHGKLDKKFETFLRQKLDEVQNKRNKIHGYLDGDDMKGYLADMVFCQGYARMNHIAVQSIIEGILKKYGIKPVSSIYTTHNYIDFRDFTLRKSAISANAGEKVIIPFNMRDGIAVCEGLGNADWLNSAPHGAGRKMSRSKAKQTLNLKDFENTMKGVYSTTVCQGTIDEAPMAYKDTDEIVRQIDGTTVKILHLYKPVINIKAIEGPKPWEK